MSDTSTRTSDYLIVGSGSAGSVLAARLSEDPRNHITVLEAGGWDRNLWTRVPIGYAKTFTDPTCNWMYESAEQEALDNRKIFCPRGKVVGGTGAINGLVYIRGQDQDFDHWRDAHGCTGWGAEDLRPYFLKSEDYFGAPGPYHAKGGPIAVSKPRDRIRLCDLLIDSAIAAGLPRNDDFNAMDQLGAGYYDLTTRNSVRSSSGNEMLRRAKKRSNVDISVKTMAMRLLFDDAGKRAIGVLARQDGRDIRFIARKEVLICAGAINSPQLLMLSGIGPGAHLRDWNIPVRLEHPGIGQNLQDHAQCRLVIEAKGMRTQNDVFRSSVGRLLTGINYLFRRRGLMTFAAGQAGIFFRSTPDLDRPDGQVLQFSYSTPKPGAPLHDFSGFTVTVCQLRPESRGEILLRSPEYSDAPRIHPNYLSTELDRAFYIRGIRFVRDILKHPPIAGAIQREYWPGADVQSDAEILAYVRGMAASIFHPCGTVAMGASEKAPLSRDLKLKGMEGVRVVDASVFPAITSGNINAPVVAVAEKAADLILSDK